MKASEIQEKLDGIDASLQMLVADWAARLGIAADSEDVDSLVTSIEERVMDAFGDDNVKENKQ